MTSRHSYVAPDRLPLNHWALTGTWTVAGHAAVSNAPGARVAFQFHARDVNLVMGPASRGAVRPVPGVSSTASPPATPTGATSAAGRQRGTVDAQRTYQLIRQPGAIADRRFEIEFLGPGAEAYCFTFG